MNVYPSEVERCLQALPGVRDCAVVGVPHERWGQTVVAVVVPEPHLPVTEQAVIDHCRRRLAGFKKPTRVVFSETLPRTSNLKLARSVLRDDVIERLG
jgi:acyl-CoA synthetase (AMP-forming)/AMP-acid ligase II